MCVCVPMYVEANFGWHFSGAIHLGGFAVRDTLIFDEALLTGLELPQARLASQLGSACLCLPIAEIIRMSHHTQLLGLGSLGHTQTLPPARQTLSRMGLFHTSITEYLKLNYTTSISKGRKTTIVTPWSLSVTEARLPDMVLTMMGNQTEAPGK